MHLLVTNSLANLEIIRPVHGHTTRSLIRWDSRVLPFTRFMLKLKMYYISSREKKIGKSFGKTKVCCADEAHLNSYRYKFVQLGTDPC